MSPSVETSVSIDDGWDTTEAVMLDTKNMVGLVTNDAALAHLEEPSTAETIAAVFGVVQRQFLIVFSLSLLGAVLAGVFLFRAPARFTATTTLLINTRKVEIVQQPAVSDELSVQAVGAMESQVELLRSDELAQRVVQKLNLLDDPRFNKRDHYDLFARLLHLLKSGEDSEPLSEADRQGLPR